MNKTFPIWIRHMAYWTIDSSVTWLFHMYTCILNTCVHARESEGLLHRSVFTWYFSFDILVVCFHTIGFFWHICGMDSYDMFRLTYLSVFIWHVSFDIFVLCSHMLCFFCIRLFSYGMSLLTYLLSVFIWNVSFNILVVCLHMIGFFRHICCLFSYDMFLLTYLLSVFIGHVSFALACLHTIRFFWPICCLFLYIRFLLTYFVVCFHISGFFWHICCHQVENRNKIVDNK